MRRITREALRGLYAPVPPALRARVDACLAGLPGRKKHLKKKTVLLLAAALVLLAGVTALAAGGGNLFRMRSGATKPLPGAEELVETCLGEAEGALMSVAVEEAVYDGQEVTLVFRVAPTDPTAYALLNEGYQETPQTEYLIREEPVPVPEGFVLSPGMETYEEDGVAYFSGITSLRVAGRRDGRQILRYGLRWELSGEAPIELDGWDAEEQADGSVLVVASGTATGPLPEELALTVRCTCRLGEQVETLPPIPITLSRRGESRSFRLTPVEDGEGERFTLLSAHLALTPVAGLLTVEYRYEESPEEPMGITWQVFDEAGNRLPDGNSRQQEEGGIMRETMEIQTFEDVPEFLTLAAKVIGEERRLGTVKCAVAPEE